MKSPQAQPQERDIAFWESQREITHEEAKEAAMRFIDGNFKNDNEPPRISIPANPDRDDDLVLLSYIAQQRRLRAQPSPRERPTEMDREVYMLKAALRRLRGAVKVGSMKEIGDALDLATDVICATYEPPMESLPKSDPWHTRFEYEP